MNLHSRRGDRRDSTERLVAAFTERTGRRPEGIWAAPGRVNLIGEHTDYNDGFVLPVALDRTTLAAVALRDDGRARCWSSWRDEPAEVALADVEPGGVDGWAAYPLGVAWALREEGVTVPGFDLVLDSDVPVGAGLSSSAALECSVALALSDLVGAGLDRDTLALVGRRAENDVVGAPTGVMDQMASMAGVDGAALLLDCRSLEHRPVDLGLRSRGLALLVVDTRASHENLDGGYGGRRRSCEEAAQRLGVTALRDVSIEQVDAARDLLGERTYRRARHVVTENARVLEVVRMVEAGRPEDAGRVFDVSHVSMRDDFEISCAELDVAVESARTSGALGARMTGGGFGGSAVALVPADAVDAVRRGVRKAFAATGFREPEVFEVTPSTGARRLR